MAGARRGALAVCNMVDEPDGDQTPFPPLPGTVYSDSGIGEAMDFQRDVRLRLLSIEQKLDSLVVKCPSSMSGIKPTNQNRSRPFPSEDSRQDLQFQSVIPPTHVSEVKSLSTGSLEVLDNGANETITANNGQGHQQSANESTRKSKHEADAQEDIGFRTTSCGRSRIRIEDRENSGWVVQMRNGATRELGNFRQSAMNDRTEHRCWKCVHSTSFQVLISFLIVCNAIVIGFNTDAELKAYMRGDQPSSEWAFVDATFAILFGAELLARIIAEGCLFLYGVDWVWNFFDSFLLALSLVNLIFTSDDMSKFSVARMVRFVRFIRLVRLARAVRAVQSLRLFILSIFASSLSFVWSLLIVTVLIYFFASIILSGVIEYFRNPENHDKADVQLEEFYGSVWRTMVTLFMSISGGVSWRDPVQPLATVHWVYEPAFTTFIFFMFFGVLNIVVGAFVTATGEIAQKDRDFLINAELESQEMYARNIKEFFAEADKDRSGMLSWEEFEEHLKNPKVSAYFASFELDVSHAHRLFKLLDSDGSGEVNPDEFLDGCMRLKGDAKSIDVNMLVYEVQRMSQQVSSLIEYMMNGNANGSGSDYGMQLA